MLKKILSLLLTVLAVVSMLTIVSSANSDMKITFDLTSGGSNTVISQPGKTVEVVFSIIRTDTESLYSFTTLGTRIIYDRNFFKYVEGSAVMIDGRKGYVSHGQMTGTDSLCIEPTRNYYPTEYYEGRVDFCKFTLEIKDGAEGSSEIKFDETYREFFDMTQNEVIPTCKSLIVTIGTPAEVNFKVGEQITPKDDVYVGMTFGEIKPENPTLPGYKFDCWTLGREPVEDEYQIKGGETFVAQFSPDFKVNVYKGFVNDYTLVIAYGNEAGAYTFNMNSVEYGMYRTTHYDDSEITYAHAFVLKTDADFDKEDAFELISYNANATAEAIEIKTEKPDLNGDGFVGIYDVGAVYYSWTADETREAACADYAIYVKRLLNSDLDTDKGIAGGDVTVVTGYTGFQYSVPQS